MKKIQEMIGRKYVVRTYSAGVHIGTLMWIDESNPKVCTLTDCTRLWCWEGSLSLSGVAERGITGGRLQKCTEITLTEAIEYIVITEKALAIFEKFYE